MPICSLHDEAIKGMGLHLGHTLASQRPTFSFQALLDVGKFRMLRAAKDCEVEELVLAYCYHFSKALLVLCASPGERIKPSQQTSLRSE